MWMEGNKLMIDNKECNRCMHCINVMPRALGSARRGLSILVGAKAPFSTALRWARCWCLS